jgi:hypothetical protein
MDLALPAGSGPRLKPAVKLSVVVGSPAHDLCASSQGLILHKIGALLTILKLMLSYKEELACLSKK